MTDTRLTPALMLRELGKLEVREVDAFVQKLHRLTATRKGALATNEARLLATINTTLPGEQTTRYRRLSAKRKSGHLTHAEQQELISLSDALEKLHARRMQSLVKLAAMRKTTLPELLQNLGLKSLQIHA